MAERPIISEQNGHLTFVREGVSIFQCLAIASALRFYAKTGMKVNRAYTPSAMMSTAARLTGQRFAKRDYLGAAVALTALADSMKDQANANL